MNESDVLALIRASTLERERIELRYATPADPDFARNKLVERLNPREEEGFSPAPKVMFYAQPLASVAPLSIDRVDQWLDSNLRQYEPLKSVGFVPRQKVGIVDGLVALNDESDGRFDRFLAVRRTGTVEYGPYCCWANGGRGENGTWLMNVKLLTAQFEQFLRFVTDLAVDFQLPTEWRVFCNARSVAGVLLFGFGKGWADPFGFRPPPARAVEDRFQFEIAFAVDGAGYEITVRELAERIDLAFGSTRPRAYDRVGEQAGTIQYGGIDYR